MKELSAMFKNFSDKSTFTLNPCVLDSGDFACWKSIAPQMKQSASGKDNNEVDDIFVDPSAVRSYNVYNARNPFVCNPMVRNKCVNLNDLDGKKKYPTLDGKNNFEVITGLLNWTCAIQRMNSKKIMDPLCEMEKPHNSSKKKLISTEDYRNFLHYQFEQIALIGGGGCVGAGTILEERFPPHHPMAKKKKESQPPSQNLFWLVVCSTKYGAYGLQLSKLPDNELPSVCRTMKQSNQNLSFLLFIVPDQKCIEPINSQFKYIVSHSCVPKATSIGLVFCIEEGVPLQKNLLLSGVTNKLLRRMFVAKGKNYPDANASSFAMATQLYTFEGAEYEKIRMKYRKPIKESELKKLFEVPENDFALSFMDQKFIDTICFDWDGLEKREWEDTTEKVLKRERTFHLDRLNPDEPIKNVYTYRCAKTKTIEAIVINKKFENPRKSRKFPYGKYMTEPEANALAFYWKDSLIAMQKKKCSKPKKMMFHKRNKQRMTHFNFCKNQFLTKKEIFC